MAMISLVYKVNRSSCSRKRKSRRNQRRGWLDKVPAAASSVNINVSASSLLANPAFGMVCVDDILDPIGAFSEYSPCYSPDPLCVNIKVDPECLQVVSPKTLAVSRMESSSYHAVEMVQLSSGDTASLPSLTIPPMVMLGDTSFQSSVEHDPRQFIDVKVSLDRLEPGTDAQPSDTLQKEISELHNASVPSPVVTRASDMNIGFSCNSPMLDNVRRWDPFGETRCPADADLDHVIVPSQLINPVHRPPVLSECVTDSDSILSSKIVMPVCEADQVPSSRDKRKKHKCPICCCFIAVADFLQHIKSHGVSTTVQTQRPRRQRATNTVPNSFACTICSFVTNNQTDFSAHLTQHNSNESSGNGTQLLTTKNTGQPTSASSMSSHSCAPSAVPRRVSGPSVIVPCDEGGPDSMSSSNVHNTSSPAVHLKTSAHPAYSSDPIVPTALPSLRETKLKQGQIQNHTKDRLKKTSDHSGLPGISSLPTTLKVSASCQFANSVNPSPSTDRSTDATCTPNPPFTATTQTAVNGGALGLNLLPQIQNITQQDSCDSNSTLLRKRRIDVNYNVASQKIPNTVRIPHQTDAGLVNDFSSSGHRRVGGLATAILPAEVSQPTENQHFDRIRQPPSVHKRSREDLCIQTDIIVMPDGSIKKTHTLCRRPLAKVSKDQAPPPLIHFPLPPKQPSQCGSNQHVSRAPPKEVLSDSVGLSSLSPRLLQTVPKEVAAIQLSPKKSSANLYFSTQSRQKQTPSIPARQSDEDYSDKLPVISHQSHPPTANGSPVCSKQTAPRESIRSTDSRLAPCAAQSPTSSLLKQSASEEPNLPIESLRCSNLPIRTSLPLGHLDRSTDNVQYLDFSQVQSTSKGQIQSCAQPEAPLLPTSANQKQFTILCPIDRFIEANAEDFNQTPVQKHSSPFNGVATNAVTPTSVNTQSLSGNKLYTQSASLCQHENVDPSSIICLEGRSGSDNSTAKSRRSTMPTRAVFSTLSPVNSTNLEMDHGHNCSLEQSTAKRGGIARPITAPKPLSSCKSSDSSINLQVFSSECSTYASPSPNPSFAAPAEGFAVHPITTAIPIPEAKPTYAIHITLQGASPTVSNSVTAPCEGACSSTNSMDMNVDSDNPGILPINNVNRVQDTIHSKPSLVQGSLCDETSLVSGIASAPTSRKDYECLDSVLKTSKETSKSNCEEKRQRCEAANKVINEGAQSTVSSHIEIESQTTDFVLDGVSSFSIIPTTNATDEAQLNTNSTSESMSSENSKMCLHDGVRNILSTEVASNHSPRPNQLASSGDNVEKTEHSLDAVDITSGNDSNDDEDTTYPTTQLRKYFFRGAASESALIVDPDYVPPPRYKHPLKTPMSVLNAIPSYEQMFRSKLSQDDSDTNTSRVDNACLACLREFPNHDLFKEHQEESYINLKCCTCSFKAAHSRSLEKHLYTHSKLKPYNCGECAESFSGRQTYINHFLEHRNDFCFMCNICDKGFNDYNFYEAHINKHFNKTPYKCRKCNNCFSSRSLFLIHMKRTHNRNVECTVCKKSVNKYRLADHMKRHKEDATKYSCEYCGKNFKLSSALAVHVLVHTGEKPYLCTYCGATFKSPYELKSHEVRHTGEHPYKCEVCGKTFAYKSPYVCHLRIHTGERPYKCEYCGMTFAQPSPYAVHKRLHTGERPYKCKICDNAYPSHAAVRNHMQTHANSGNVQKRTMTTRGTTSKPKKPRKGRSVSVIDNSSSSDSEKEPTEVGVVQPRRRSSRLTKCTKSLDEKEIEKK